jgi:hypothetical protein
MSTMPTGYGTALPLDGASRAHPHKSIPWLTPETSTREYGIWWAASGKEAGVVEAPSEHLQHPPGPGVDFLAWQGIVEPTKIFRKRFAN